jgi:hypothetical protein
LLLRCSNGVQAAEVQSPQRNAPRVAFPGAFPTQAGDRPLVAHNPSGVEWGRQLSRGWLRNREPASESYRYRSRFP